MKQCLFFRVREGFLLHFCDFKNDILELFFYAKGNLDCIGGAVAAYARTVLEVSNSIFWNVCFILKYLLPDLSFFSSNMYVIKRKV